MKKHILSAFISGVFAISAMTGGTLHAAENDVKKEVIKETSEEFEYKTSDKAPEGFEDILNSTNYGFIDIYFANKYLGSFQSEYNYEKITFFENDIIYDLLTKEVTFLDPENVKTVLAKPLSLNANFNCNNNEVCEDFVPEVIGVVFDETTLSAKIHLNYDQIKEEKKDYSALLAPSTSQNSFIQSLDLSFFGGTDQEETSYSLSGGTYLAHKEHRIKSSWIQSQDDFYFNQLYYGTDLEGYKVKAGYMTSNSFGYTFTPTFRMLGFEYGTSINTRKDLQTEFSEPMHVFLNQRAAVKITRDQELIYTAYHDAGNQIISTDNFPSGSYNVKIEIIEDNGSTRTIEKFFVKSISIPPEGEDIFYINAGWMEDENDSQDDDYLDVFNLDNEDRSIPTLPDTEDEIFVKLGYSNRFNDQTALYNELLYKESDYLYNPTVYFLGNGYDLKTSLIYGSNDAQGITLDVNIPMEQHNFSLFGRYVTENSNKLVFGEGTSLTASYNVNMYDYGSLSLFTSYDKSAVTDIDNTTYSMGYRKNLYQDPSGSLNFNFDVSKNDEESYVNVGLTYYFNSKSNWSFKTSPSWQKNGDNEDYRLNNSLRVSGDNSRQTQWHANLNTSNSKSSKNVFFNSSISDQRYGTATIDVNHDYTDQSKTTYIGNITTNIVSDSNNIAVGGKRRLESGIIIDLKQYEKEDDFELFVNDISTDYVKSGKETFIPLVPYKEYNMYLRSKSTDNFVQVTRKQNWVVPYPGNVQSLNWDINKIAILSSQLVDEFGNLVVSQPIYVDSNKTYTDEVGYFQLEIINSDKVLWANIKENKCSVDLTEIMTEDIVYKEELICYYEDGVNKFDVQPDIEDTFIANTLGGIPQKDIIDSINGNIIDIAKLPKVETVAIIPNACYSPYESKEYVVKRGNTLGNIVRNEVLGKNAPYLEISSIIKDVAKCNNMESLNSLTIGETILIPNMKVKVGSVVDKVTIKEIKPKVVSIKKPDYSKSCYSEYQQKDHIVGKRDTLSNLARTVTGKNAEYSFVNKVVQEIISCNKNLVSPNDLSLGMTLSIPTLMNFASAIVAPAIIPSLPSIDLTSSGKEIAKSKNVIKTPVIKDHIIFKNNQQCYIVQKGDWLHKISRRFMPHNSQFFDTQKMVMLISENNNIYNPNLIEVGDEICIPDYKLIKHVKVTKTKVEDLPKKEIKQILVQPKTTKISLINDITKLVLKENFIKQSDKKLFITYLKLKIPDNVKAWDNLRDYELLLTAEFKDVCIKFSKKNGLVVFTVEKLEPITAV
jgi:outer membrane usher protein FimD/PapC/nucleoid-associated protein YgaU